MKMKQRICAYFLNLYSAVLGRTGFRLYGAKPDAWHVITSYSSDGMVIQAGWIKTDKNGNFIPFIKTENSRG